MYGVCIKINTVDCVYVYIICMEGKGGIVKFEGFLSLKSAPLDRGTVWYLSECVSDVLLEV